MIHESCPVRDVGWEMNYKVNYQLIDFHEALHTSRLMLLSLFLFLFI
jgi:hypothetical protein